MAELELCRREVFFEANGVPRVVEVKEKLSESAGPSRKAAREKGDPSRAGSISAPMNGDVIDIKTKAGPSLLSCIPLLLQTVIELPLFLPLHCL